MSFFVSETLDRQTDRHTDRLGGFGMTSLASVSQPAFVASWCNATAELPLRFPSLIPTIDSLVISQRQALSKALTQSIPVGETVSSFLSSTEKIQHQLYTSIAKHEAEQLISEAPTARDVSRLYSSKVKGAGAWLNAIPTSEVFTLDMHEFHLAILRLGLSIHIFDWMTTCNCGVTLDGSGYHLLTFKSGGGPVWLHEAIASTWSDCL